MDVKLSQMIFSASIKVIMIFVFHSINVKSHKLTCICRTILTSLVAQMVKNLPAMWETRVPSLDQEVPLEKGMAIHSSILVWKIPWTEEPGELQFMGLQRVRDD